MEFKNDILVSKTSKKKHMDKLQDLGMSLTKLTKEQLLKMNLSDVLLDAVLIYKSLDSNKAQKRQAQYIGKVMRDEDELLIKNKLDDVFGDNAKSTKLLHDVEIWRDKLLISDDELESFIYTYNNIEIDITLMRQIIRLARKETNSDNKLNIKKLFKLIKQILIDHG
jgi:ribosome-associated protein